MLMTRLEPHIPEANIGQIRPCSSTSLELSLSESTPDLGCEVLLAPAVAGCNVVTPHPHDHTISWASRSCKSIIRDWWLSPRNIRQGVPECGKGPRRRPRPRIPILGNKHEPWNQSGIPAATPAPPQVILSYTPG